VTADLRGAEQLTAIFGRWPSFHDAEVVRLGLDRASGVEGAWGPTLNVDVYVFQAGPNVAANGMYVLRHETLVSFRFCEVDQLELREFNQQNAIWDLSITDISERQLERARYEVRFAPSFGVDAGFLCFDAEVVSVRPWTQRDRSG
jgi:Immunity protein 50